MRQEKERSPKEIHENFHARQRLMSFNGFLSGHKRFFALYGLISILLFLLLNYFLSIAEQFPVWFQGFSLLEGESEAVSVNWSLLQLFRFQSKYGTLYIIFALLLIAGSVKWLYNVQVAFGDLNVGQKGTARPSTRKEIEAQYKLVPERGERFPGGGGVPIARKGDSIFIDDSPTNTLTIGITRSGKGELVGFPSIDIYSRAEMQASMIITDPKLEQAASAIPTLTARGYECHLLNLVDPEFSMGFNPLTLIVAEYKAGEMAKAQLLCGAFCYSIFNPDAATGDNKFFECTSTSLLAALIFARMEDSLKADEELNKQREYEHQQREKKKKEAALSALPARQAKQYLLKEAIDQALAYMPDATDEYLAGELSSDIKRIRYARENPLPKIEYTEDPFVTIHPNEKQINMYSIYNMFAVLSASRVSASETELDAYFSERPEGSFARLRYAPIGSAGEKTKGSIYSNMTTGLEVFVLENIAKMTAESTVDLKMIGFGAKPIAIFIGLPDYDQSNYFIATAFIRQLYFTLAKMATHAPGGKCYREVIFLLDEFGNIPPIENMDNIITVCLGRNIRFNLIIQSYSQLYKLYEEHGANTIKGNCGNQIYILTSDPDTAEEFSGLLGEETITTINRTGKRLSIHKELTEMTEERRLLNANELMKLEPGETIVHRTIKREDLDRESVKANPIFNMGQHRMKYRYRYLLTDFPSGNILYDSPNVRKVFALIRETQREQIARGAKGIELIGNPIPIDVKIEDTTHIELQAYTWSAQSYLEQREKLSAPAIEVMDHNHIKAVMTLFRLPGDWQKKCWDGEVRVMDLQYHAQRLLAAGQKELAYPAFAYIDEAIGKTERPSEELLFEKEQSRIFDQIAAAGGFAHHQAEAEDIITPNPKRSRKKWA